MAITKIRADQALVTRGLVKTRSKAQALIMAGKVFTGEQRVEKPGVQIRDDKPLDVRGQDHPWVGRGGLKLAHAIEYFGLDAVDTTAIDVGSSTGGFTDVLLANGAAKVFAVDVGKGQLDWKLRTDDRVIVLEGQNARHLTAEHIPHQAGAIVCDASFIGLATVLPTPMSFAASGAWIAALIKPQFEAGRGNVGKNGVVKDNTVREAVVDRIQNWLANDMGWQVMGITESPITGAEGNVEYLIAATKP